MVLRHYKRGGLVAKLVKQSYLFIGWKKTRSYQEFQVLKQLYRLDLPVPEPVAAWAHRYYGASYRAAILTRRICGAVPFPEVDNPQDYRLWRNVGLTIRRFHDAGLDHVDLNCDNILLAQQNVYLIDFDKCRLRSTGSGKKWKQANLDRLRRSITKRMALSALDKYWSVLIDAYQLADNDPVLAPAK
jgi:3-deoxy-D-manno-octulosonic acid kinase